MLPVSSTDNMTYKIYADIRGGFLERDGSFLVFVLILVLTFCFF